jgi:hypothetical protein
VIALNRIATTDIFSAVKKLKIQKQRECSKFYVSRIAIEQIQKDLGLVQVLECLKALLTK